VCLRVALIGTLAACFAKPARPTPACELGGEDAQVVFSDAFAGTPSTALKQWTIDQPTWQADTIGGVRAMHATPAGLGVAAKLDALLDDGSLGAYTARACFYVPSPATDHVTLHVRQSGDDSRWQTIRVFAQTGMWSFGYDADDSLVSGQLAGPVVDGWHGFALSTGTDGTLIGYIDGVRVGTIGIDPTPQAMPGTIALWAFDEAWFTDVEVTVP
jgi:hypothetical protein